MTRPVPWLRPRARKFAFAISVFLVMIVAGYTGADSGVVDPYGFDAETIRSALGPSATRLPSGLWQVTLDDGKVLTTHGPDPEEPEGHGSAIGANDPERVPYCATTRAQHVLYGYPAGSTNRYNTVKLQIQRAMRRINAVLAEESVESGGPPVDYKVVCDGGTTGDITVGQFSSPGNAFSTVAQAARNAGYDRGDLNYSIFYDGSLSGVCGTGSFNQDSRPLAENFNNWGGEYAVNYSGCWDNRTPMHENGHNMGAVQPDAPDSTGSGLHCNDTDDVMCYAPDGGNKNQTEVRRCTDKMHYDCDHDSYFDSAVEAGEWLAGHWNIGASYNRFIVFGYEPPPPPPNQPPAADFTFSCFYDACDFISETADESPEWLVQTWDFGDGYTTQSSGAYHYFANAGTYNVTLQARDIHGLIGSITKAVTISFDDPDPSVPTLTNDVRKYDRVGATGTWDYFKIGVSPGTVSLKVDLRSTPCGNFGICNRTLDAFCVVGCHSQLDLYVQFANKPTTGSWACRGYTDTNQEVCTVTNPRTGWYYVGVHAYRGVEDETFSVRGVTSYW